MSIYNLVADIQATLKSKGTWFTEEISKEFSDEISVRLREQFGRENNNPSLRLSQMGPRCPCALWHSIHAPELAERLPPWAELKYAFGHIIEGLAIGLAKAAGHHVVGEQDEVCVDGIVGHRDCVIDGCIVDVKSSSTFGFAKFKDGSIKENDPFGYLDQLDGYLVGSLGDPLVTVKDKAYLLAIDKTLGHMALYEHRIREDNIRQRIRDYKDICSLSSAPQCNCQTIADGESGNVKLDTKASYSSYKFCCFPYLRTFLYAGGPRYLTKVVRKPYDAREKRYITEVDRHGKVVYN